MKTNKQNADFLYIGEALLHWFKHSSRDLPFRSTKDPYRIWICEVIFQQTRISQGLQHYEKFVERFPDVFALASAEPDEVLLYWKGLGYYSRALNIHKTAKIIAEKYSGVFPVNYSEILALPGIGKYTAAAICSICFGGKLPAVDGNFYRVLSRVFADDFDISSPKAFDYFSNLAFRIMPENNAGNFNQAMMDLGSEVCTPKNPKCEVCPLQEFCIAFQTGKVYDFPVKIKKTKVSYLALSYYFVKHKHLALVSRRNSDFIWKNLYEFPVEIPDEFLPFIKNHKTVNHKLSHKNLEITFSLVDVEDENQFKNFAEKHSFSIITKHDAAGRSFPKPLQTYLENVDF